MNLYWQCPNCKEKVNFSEEMSYVFDEEGEADFDPSRGLFFHTIYCECGINWNVSISKPEKSE